MAVPELQRLSHYPFLRAASEFMAEQDISLGEIISDRTYEGARTGGLNRLLGTLQFRRIDPPACSSYADHLNEILSYVVARIIASSVGDPMLIKWYSVAEATRAANLLQSEDTGFILEVARELDLGIELIGGSSGGRPETDGISGAESPDFRMHFTDYLSHAPRLKSSGWKLVNMPLKDGVIPLSRKRTVRVLREVLSKKFENERERVEYLFQLYEQITAPLAPSAPPKKRRRLREKR